MAALNFSASLKKFKSESTGSFAINFAIMMPVLLALAAGGLDFTAYNQQKAAMQSAADAAAVAAVKEAALKGWSSSIADSVAGAVVDSNYAPTNAGKDYHVVSTFPDEANRKITVKVVQDHYPYFMASIFPSPQLQVEATATASGSTNICVIGLDEKQSETVSLEDQSKLTASKCAVYSNSEAVDGLSAINSSILTAQLTCSAGGVRDGVSNITNDAITDCPRVADPLSARPEPSSSGACDHNNLSIKGEGTYVTLAPGIYCGGLNIQADAIVDLTEGIYIIKDGPLSLGANASLYGRGVGFYFTGDDADFSLASGSSVDLEAPETGALAGLLFFQERGADEADFLLRSNKASTLVGTIYLPNGNFIIDTNSKVADASAYTAIVARTLTLMRKPNVVLNTDYSATDVPVPAGIGGPGNNAIRLLN